MSNSTQCCSAHGATLLERPRFFPRQLVTPDDLTLGLDYFREKLRRTNRYLHGWGVVCGALVDFAWQDEAMKTPRPWKVIVNPGYLLGPFGDEIVIDREVCFDLRTRCFTAAVGDPCADQEMDCGCGTASQQKREAGDWHIVVRYKEFPARPVRVQSGACGCDDSACEYSRWRDGYEICVVKDCPAAQAGTSGPLPGAKAAANPPCPPCPDDPWVGLAKVTVDLQGNVTKISNCACRRIVPSFAGVWMKCNDGDRTPPPRATDPTQVTDTTTVNQRPGS